jgi:hypothetical protein
VDVLAQFLLLRGGGRFIIAGSYYRLRMSIERSQLQSRWKLAGMVERGGTSVCSRPDCRSSSR